MVPVIATQVAEEGLDFPVSDGSHSVSITSLMFSL